MSETPYTHECLSCRESKIFVGSQKYCDECTDYQKTEDKLLALQSALAVAQTRIEELTERAERAENFLEWIEHSLQQQKVDVPDHMKDPQMRVCFVFGTLRQRAESAESRLSALTERCDKAEKDRTEARELYNLIAAGLRWTGDGYEWLGGEYDYRIKPEESVAYSKNKLTALTTNNERLEKACNIFQANSASCVKLWECVKELSYSDNEATRTRANHCLTELPVVPEDHVAALTTENERLAKLTEWHDIETAPKDGTKILVIKEYFDPYRKLPMSWHDIAYWTTHNSGGWVSATAGTPTHWRPLPPPPADGGVR